MKAQLLRFGMVGVAGYVVDALVLYLLMAAGMGFLRGRLVSFVCAVMTTFVLNRRYTFAEQLHGSAGPRPPLWLEFGHYLAAMALGGLLNLATYWFILRVTPHFPALYALAIGAGSLVGMTANFASAKWWVFMRRPEHRRFELPRVKLTTARCLILVQAVFWTAHLTEVDLPGLYQDAVNPDYLAAKTLNPELPNPVWIQPTVGLPVLGSLYHGVQNFYVAVPVFALLGFNMFALRVAQGLFAGGVLVMTQLVLQRVSGSLGLALAGSLGLATELAFLASFRTQMYIIVSGAFWLLLAIYLALGQRTAATAPALSTTRGTSWRDFMPLPAKYWLLSGLCFGLAAYSYFVFLFFLPVFVAFGWAHTRNWRPVLFWLLGFAVGMQTYVLGYSLAAISLGGIKPFVEWLLGNTQGLAPMSSELGLMGRVANAWTLVVGTLQNVGNELMIFGSSEHWMPAGAWSVWKSRLLLLAVPTLAILGIVRGWKQRGEPQVEAQTGSLLAPWHIALLPVSFFAVSLIFGSRLWAHHFSQLVPLAYVILFIAVYQLQTILRMRLPTWAGVALMAVFITDNVYQQRIFFDRLVTTGGVAIFSDALNRMADDAMAMPEELVHVFPEWGFGMPFATLTGNRRRYEADLGDATLQRLATAGSTLRIYYWQPEPESSYREQLLAHGYRISSTGTYLQRDQKVAFYWMDASVAGSE